MRTYHLTFVSFAVVALIVFGHTGGATSDYAGKGEKVPSAITAMPAEPKESTPAPTASFFDSAYAFPSLSPLFAPNIGTASMASEPQTQAKEGVLTTETLPAIFRAKSEEPAPSVPIVSGLVADLSTQEVYWNLEMNKQWPLASITKLVTGMQAVAHVSSSQAIAITDAEFSYLGDAGTSGFLAGESYSGQDLIRAMLLFSSNESAEALARAQGRSEFMAGMNELAESIGARATYFDDPTGLSVANQSTASDIARIAKAVYNQYPEFLRATRVQKLTLTELTANKKSIYPNINTFAGRADFIGGKTGYTEEAGGNLVSIFAYEGRPIVLVVLGADDRFAATESLLQWFKRTHSSR
jgi:D-alanyl-D-alanine endopeptidase (penicillin-binding protein 7)